MVKSFWRAGRDEPGEKAGDRSSTRLDVSAGGQAAQLEFVKNFVAPQGLFGITQMVLLHAQAQLAYILRIVADKRNHPVLFHCSLGKDRTGIVSALILSICRIDREDIVLNYSQSAAYLRDARDVIREENFKKGLDEKFDGTPREVMDSIFAWIDERWGGVATYLNDACGFTYDEQAKMRRCLTVKNRDYIKSARESRRTSRSHTITSQSHSNKTNTQQPNNSSSVSNPPLPKRPHYDGPYAPPPVPSRPHSASAPVPPQFSLSPTPPQQHTPHTSHTPPTPQQLPPLQPPSPRNQSPHHSPRGSVPVVTPQYQQQYQPQQQTPQLSGDVMQRTVLVTGIPFETSHDQLLQFFRFCGDILLLSIDRATESAILFFAKKESAETALFLNNGIVGHSPVHVALFKPGASVILARNLASFLNTEQVYPPRRPTFPPPIAGTLQPQMYTPPPQQHQQHTQQAPQPQQQQQQQTQTSSPQQRPFSSMFFGSQA
eukprot:TRINITY_DN2316_c0_g1_i2.p1 TRINITY_DN2316_c0_g1~~TRINITY_DN2316_c0_g1_i2.p1  ORF type:complete len:488 (-),score=111.10 TRINITY_DN2316_c0_g1_i2:4-1467(-)